MNKVTDRLIREVVQKATVSQRVWSFKLACLWICFPHVRPVATHAEQKVVLVESYYLQPAFCYHPYKLQFWRKREIFTARKCPTKITISVPADHWWDGDTGGLRGIKGHTRAFSRQISSGFWAISIQDFWDFWVNEPLAPKVFKQEHCDQGCVLNNPHNMTRILRFPLQLKRNLLYFGSSWRLSGHRTNLYQVGMEPLLVVGKGWCFVSTFFFGLEHQKLATKRMEMKTNKLTS